MESVDDDDDEETIDVNVEGLSLEPIQVSPAADPGVPNTQKRPKKRQKLGEPVGRVLVENDMDVDVDMDVLDAGEDRDMTTEEGTSAPAEGVTVAQSRPKSPTSQTALPSFPLPTVPDAPSKSELALLGLDKALLNAEVIDPSVVLPIPPGDGDSATHLSEKMKRRLADLGITELFAVQTALLPFLLPLRPMDRQLYLPYNPPRDVCVSAPTGSGKTLAYALPIIELLSTRVVTRLRALIVLPTRDLVLQVRETFDALAKGRGLQIGTATGQHSFAHEQSQLVGNQSTRLAGGSSKVDILICTPGRLMDHLNGTSNFTLQHLRFMVIDEADRLLAQSFQDWLAQVLAATRPPRQTPSGFPIADLAELNTYPDAVAPAFAQLHPFMDIPTFYMERKESSCQKLLFSATLTRDPGKIAALDLRDPKYFIVQGNKGDSEPVNLVMEKFTMPATLKEHMIVCEGSEKPLVLYHLVLAHNVVNALVFTKSAESTTRLVQLFNFLEQARQQPQKQDSSGSANPPTPIRVQAYSSDLPVGERKILLEQFKAQEVQILVCSDLISRGIDISHVSHVVSYDVPVDMRKYVHRVGRTARAGRAGDAWSLVEEQEARYFKNMLKEADHLANVKRLRVGKKDLESLTPFYQTALDNLKEVYTR